MYLRLARWSPGRMRAVWALGLLLETALLLVMLTLFRRPEPHLVAHLRGEDGSAARSVFYSSSRTAPTDTVTLRAATAPPVAVEDSFYTILHWPLDRPLLAGGGRVVTLPMRLWWVPALYAGAVPLLLVCITGAWLRVRRRATGTDPAS